MTDRRIEDEYENYEPELNITWYVLLGLFIPLIPFAVFLIANWGHFLVKMIVFNVIAYMAVAFSLISAAVITRSGSRRGLLLLSAIIWLLVVIGEWGVLRYLRSDDGYVLGIPIAYALLSALMPIYAYSFYSRRKRLAGWLLMLGLATACVIIVTFFFRIPSEVPELVGYTTVSMSALMILLALFILICTRRSEACPWYINIVLSLLTIGSALLGRNFIEYLKVGDITFTSLIVNLGTSIISDYNVAFYVSYCFVFSSLGMKSCFKSLKRLDDSKYDENAETVKEGEDEISQEAPTYADRDNPYDRKDRLRYPEDAYALRHPYDDRYPTRDSALYRDFGDSDDYMRGYEDAIKAMERERERRYYSPDSRDSRRYIEDRRRDAERDDRHYDSSSKSQSDRELRKYRFGNEYRKRDKFFDLLRGEIPDDEYEVRDDWPKRR